MLNNPWLIGIITSIVGGILISIAISAFSLRFRTAVLRTLLHLARAGVYQYFRTQNGATEVIRENCQQAKEVRIMAVRAWSLFPVAQEESQLGDILKGKGIQRDLRILLLSPFLRGTESEVAFIDKRAEEVDKIYDRETHLREQVALTIDHIRDLKRNGLECKLRLYNELPVFKIVIFDDNAFVGGFNRENVGHNNPMYHVRRNEGVLFDLADRYFNYIWDYRSVDYEVDGSALESVKNNDSP